MARKKSDQSTAPKKPGRFSQISQIRKVYTAARGMDPMIGWWMLLASLGTLIVMVVIGILVS
ncbi:MAG: DUF4191 domain-containing protein, partial [Dermatophilaceae bacterium]